MKITLFFIILFYTMHSQAIEVHGHRGARARFPENSIPAFKYALEKGVDYLELDLGVTKDNILVVNHDFEVNSQLCIAKGPKKYFTAPLVHDLTLKEVQDFDCGSVQNPKFTNQQILPGTKIPTLDEFFEMIKHSDLKNAKTVKFNIETKIEAEKPNATVTAEKFASLYVKKMKQHHMLDRVLMQSFDFRTLVAARKLEPKIRISLLIENKTDDMVALAKKYKADVVSPDFNLLTKEIVDNLHLIKVKVTPWTVNTESDWQKVIEMGVDGIITDDPEALIAYLNKKGLR